MTVKLQVLGMGCAKCVKLGEAAEAAARALGLEYALEKVSDPEEFVRLGVMVTPALLVDGKLVAVGKVPSAKQLEELLRRA